MKFWSGAVIRERARDLLHCATLMRNPMQAYGYLRTGRRPEVAGFHFGSLKFIARKQDWKVIREVIIEDEYACVDTLLADRTRPKVLDLGANVGCFALRVLRRFPDASVASVEAARDTFEVLRGNRDQNPAYDWTVMNNGVWGDDRPLTLVRRGIAMAHRVVEGVGAESIEGITLAALVRQLGWERIDLMKIDIEGGEESVVPAAGDVLAMADTLIIEVHTDRIDSRAVMSALHAAFKHVVCLEKRDLSSKPVYVCSHVPAPLGGIKWRPDSLV